MKTLAKHFILVVKP